MDFLDHESKADMERERERERKRDRNREKRRIKRLHREFNAMT